MSAFFSKNPVVRVVLVRAVLFSAAVCLALLGLWLMQDWLAQGLAMNWLSKNQPPSLVHWFGTDWLGRDMLARTIAGMGKSIYVGGLAVIITGNIALLLICLSLVHEKLNALVSLLIDVMLALPHLLLLILFALVFGGGSAGLIIALALSHWPKLTRLLQLEMQQQLTMPYLALSQQFGYSKFYLFKTHLLPHLWQQFWLALLLLFPHVLLHLAALTFLGFGLDPLNPSMGEILAQVNPYLVTGHWWLAVFPGGVLLSFILLLVWLGQRLTRKP